MNFRDNPNRTITLIEKFDTANVSRLLLSDLLDATGKRTLEKYVKKLQNGAVEVEYTNKELGRLEAKMTRLKKGETCYTQMRLYNIMKAVGCRDIYTDVDIKNCHPTLLAQLFEAEGCDTKYLSMYVDSRQELIEQMGVPKVAIKQLMFGLIYKCGQFNAKAWMREHKITELPQLFSDLQAEVQTNTAIVLEKYHEYRQLAKKRKQPGYWNVDGSALSYLAQQMEKTCLLAAYDYLNNEGWTIGALIHDGMHIEGDVPADTLAACCQYVLDKTGFRIQLETKPFANFDAQLDAITIIDDDYEACQIILDSIEKSTYDLVKCNGRMYFRSDDVYIPDATKKHDELQSHLMNFINQLTLFKQVGPASFSSVTRNFTAANNVMKFVFNHARVDSHFADKMVQWSKAKLCYKNGYYDFRKSKLLPYDDSVMTTIRIDRDYVSEVSQDDIDECYARLLDPIFTENTVLRDFWLKLFARVMAGHVEDKQWMVMMGERNSGKGVLVLLFMAAFEGYVTITDANHFLAKRGSGDAALDMKWAVGLDMVRAVFTNEIKMEEEKEAKLDGAMMKKIASGGDVIECRGLFEKSVKFVMQCQFCLMLNDMPEANTTDAMSNCHEFQMKSQFVKGEPQSNGIVKEYKADDSIKDYIKTDRCINAFTHILFQHYDTKPPEVPEEIQQNAQDNAEESDLAQFLRLFEFTNNPKDVVTVAKFNSVVENKLNVTKKKVKTWLKSKGIVQGKESLQDTGKQVRVYQGLRLAPPDFDANSDDSLSDIDPPEPTPSKPHSDFKYSYEEKNNYMKEYVMERITPSPDHEASSLDIRDDFEQWCEANDYKGLYYQVHSDDLEYFIESMCKNCKAKIGPDGKEYWPICFDNIDC